MLPVDGDTQPDARSDADQAAMRVAFDLATTAGEAGEVPVGAVVVIGGQVVAAAGNERERRQDPTAHAEIVALRAAAEHEGSWRLGGATLYCTLEPCPMCAGAALAARVSRLVFAAPDPKAGAAGSLYNLCADPRLNHEITVESGVLGAECASLLSAWFAARRRGAGLRNP